jgi:hypothetical protein
MELHTMSKHPESAIRMRTADIISLMSPRPLWRLARGIVRAPLDEHCFKAGILERSRLFGLLTRRHN